MTREEEIKNEAKLKCHDIAGEADYKSSAAYDGFVMGAKWADEHPKEGLVSIDKVCAYLEMRLDEYIIRDLKNAICFF